MKNTISQLISIAADRLGSRFDAKQLMCMSLGVDLKELSLRLRDIITPAQISDFNKLVLRREGGEPLQYILGEWEFYGMKFYVGNGVLIPRQDTETLVESVLASCGESSRILEIGAGSGCICCVLKKLIPSANITAVEKSPEAFLYLTKNINLHSLEINAVLGDALNPDECLSDSTRFDIILSNPPYLTELDMNLLQKEVSFEPSSALYGGRDGLDFYRSFTKIWVRKLSPNGSFFYESGYGQTEDIEMIFKANGLTKTEAFRDAAGKLRVVKGSRI